MGDRVLIPLGALGVLDLPRELFERHLVQPQAASAAPAAAELVDAEQLEARTGVPASWWMEQARQQHVPARKLGRYTRFNVAEVLGSEAFKRRAIHNAARSST